MKPNEYAFIWSQNRRRQLNPLRKRQKMIVDDRLNAQAALVNFMRKKREKAKVKR